MSYRELSQTTRTAAKEHLCTWCGETIVVGERYCGQSGIHDGEFQSCHLHLECDKACEEWFASGDVWADEGYDPHSFKRGSVEER